MEEQTKTFDQWAIVEVMGHNKFAGRVTEETVGGASFVRVDVPDVPPVNGRGMRAAFTKLLGAGSIFAITPCTQDIARRAAAQFRSEAFHLFESTVSATPVLAHHDDYDDCDFGDDDLSD